MKKSFSTIFIEETKHAKSRKLLKNQLDDNFLLAFFCYFSYLIGYKSYLEWSGVCTAKELTQKFHYPVKFAIELVQLKRLKLSHGLLHGIMINQKKSLILNFPGYGLYFICIGHDNPDTSCYTDTMHTV